jgi:hypothetical protein
VGEESSAAGPEGRESEKEGEGKCYEKKTEKETGAMK